VANLLVHRCTVVKNGKQTVACRVTFHKLNIDNHGIPCQVEHSLLVPATQKLILCSLWNAMIVYVQFVECEQVTVCLPFFTTVHLCTKRFATHPQKIHVEMLYQKVKQSLVPNILGYRYKQTILLRVSFHKQNMKNQNVPTQSKSAIPQTEYEQLRCFNLLAPKDLLQIHKRSMLKCLP